MSPSTGGCLPRMVQSLVDDHFKSSIWITLSSSSCGIEDSGCGQSKEQDTAVKVTFPIC